MLTIKVPRHKTGATCNMDQFDLLMKCSAEHDMTEWNEWRKHNPNVPVVLRNVNIKNAYLRGADLRKADFRGANLRGLDLSGAKRPDFTRRWADLSGADFTKADLCGTDFRGANLSDVNFDQAYLFFTNLSWTNLKGASFNGTDLWAFLYRADLTAVDLSRSNRRISDFTKIGCKHTKLGTSPCKPAWLDQIGRPQPSMKVCQSGMAPSARCRRLSDKGVNSILRNFPDNALDTVKRKRLLTLVTYLDSEANSIAISRESPDFATISAGMRAVG